MNKHTKQQQLESFWEQTLKDNYLISEIDFEKDIDREKTKDANCFIDSNESLRFYGNVEHEFNESELLLEDDGKEVFLTNINTAEFKSMYIDTSNVPLNFQIVFSNKRYKQQLQSNIFELMNNKKLKNKKEITNNINYTLLDINGSFIDIKTKNEIQLIFEETTVSINNIVKGILINFHNKKITFLDIEGNKKEVYWTAINKEEIILLSSVNLQNRIKIYNEIKDYIYFKAIKNMHFNKLEICMSYKGKPQIEYYNKSRDKWITIKKNSIESLKELELRVKMGLEDEIYSIAMLKNKEDLHREYENVRVIDFNNDIDVDKSGMFYIDPVKQVLEFKMGDVKKLSIDDFEVLCGEVVADEDKIIMYPQNYYAFKENQKYSAISTKVLGDIYYVEYERRSSDLRIFIGLHENNTFQCLKNSILNNEKFNNPYTMNLEYKFIDFYFTRDYVILFKNNEDIFQDISVCVDENLKEYNSVYFNINKSTISINNKQKFNINFDIEEFFTHKPKQLKITAYSFKKNRQENLEIKNILCGKSIGYIYFRDLGKFKNPKLLCPNLNIEFQYYCYDEDKWVNINEFNKLSISKELNMRCKMFSDDKLYNIFIIDDI